MLARPARTAFDPQQPPSEMVSSGERAGQSVDVDGLERAYMRTVKASYAATGDKADNERILAEAMKLAA